MGWADVRLFEGGRADAQRLHLWPRPEVGPAANQGIYEAATAINGVFNAVLGRSETSNMGAWQGYLSDFRSLADIQWTLAHVQEAADRINDVFWQTLHRFESNNMGDWQNWLATRSLADVRSNLAHSPEGGLAISGMYGSVLEIVADPTNGWVMANYDYEVSFGGSDLLGSPARARALQRAVVQPGQDVNSILVYTIPVRMSLQTDGRR